MSPQLSVILPVFNRCALLPHPLDSLRAAAAATPGLAWELVLVDDGSTEDLAAVLADYRDLPIRLHRLPANRGLLHARLFGLGEAHGEAVMFLDADDAVLPGKFSTQLPALAGADVVHGDLGRRPIDAHGRPAGPLRTDAPARPQTDPVAFYLLSQPAPHDPIFRRQYLQEAVRPARCAPDRAYDAIAETWLYYHLALRPARIRHCPGLFSVVGEPAGERLSRKWERQCAAALRLMEAFLAATASARDTTEFRRTVGRCAFSTWRALPADFPPAERLLRVWRACPPTALPDLGGPVFRRLARLLGPVRAGRLLRWLQRPSYRRVRTASDAELQALFA